VTSQLAEECSGDTKATAALDDIIFLGWYRTGGSRQVGRRQIVEVEERRLPMADAVGE
jgi:hypothetical protein